MTPAANHRFIHHMLTHRYGALLPTLSIVDFGCGDGALVEFLRAQGLNAQGCDPYGVRYGAWVRDKPYLHKIENGRLPFEGDSVDIVVSNQVFEHIDDHLPCLFEIHRILKHDGWFLSLFPTVETLYEVHSGVWFAWYLRRVPRLLRLYLYLWRCLGVGLWKDGVPKWEWARLQRDVIVNECPYKSQGHVKRLWSVAFGHQPRTWQAEYLKFRLPRLTKLPDALASLITSLRAGIVISIVK